MASFGGGSEGDVDDGVRLRFGNIEPKNFEDYSARISILQQPAIFTSRLSKRDGSAKLLKDIPNNTKFTLFIGILPQFGGFTDGLEGSGTSGSTAITFKGRDVLGKMFGNDVPHEQSFTNVTYADIFRKAMDASGLEDRKLIFSNATNRKIRTGINVRVIKEPTFPTGVIRADGGTVVKHVVRAKLGEDWLQFGRRHIAKGGLSVWSDTDANVVLSSPNPHQPPLFYWERQRNRLTNRVNVTDAHFVNDTTNRFSEIIIYARCGGRKSGRGKLHGGHEDPEMVKLGIDRVKVYRDVNVTSVTEAEFYARRKIAEINRAAWHLTYTFAGHTAPALYGGRTVISPDLIAYVKDEEFGIDEPMYIETVEYKSPPQTTTVTLMRIKDLIFGSDD